MGKRLLQKRQSDGQQTHEKMLNITNHQGNANQNYNEVTPHTDQNGHHQKCMNNICWEGCEKRETTYIVDGNVSWYSHYGKQYEGSSEN